MPDRRSLLLAAAAFLAPPFAVAQVPERFAPPPPGDDAYGLTPFVGAQPQVEALLRELREPTILGRDSPLADKPVFRLTQLYEIAYHRSALLIFNGLTGSAECVIRDARAPKPPAGMRPIDIIRGFDDDDGVKLRAFIDDRERFWEAAPRLPDNRAGYVDGGATLLEGRVGARRQAIWRENPPESAFVSQLAERLF